MEFIDTLDVADQIASQSVQNFNKRMHFSPLDGQNENFDKAKESDRYQDKLEESDQISGNQVFEYSKNGRNEGRMNLEERDFEVSFKFENKEMENLNDENLVFNSRGKPNSNSLEMKDSLEFKQSLISKNSLKEFEDIHEKAKSVLSQGNFSFGRQFYDSDTDKNQNKVLDTDPDTFELEEDEDQNHQDYYEVK
jgi:hypothetical protein